MSSPSTSGKGPGASKLEEDVDVGKLSQAKIKELMHRDPKFIGRLIHQLDKTMHSMMKQKQLKQQQIEDEEAEIGRLNDTIKSHIKPNLDRLDGSIREKTALREHLLQQIDVEFGKLKKLEEDARKLIQASRHTAGGLMRKTATQRLEEARGFSATVPTTTLLRTAGGSGSASPASLKT